MISLENIGPYIVLAIVALYLMVSIRIAREHERFVIFMVGRFYKLKGPGLLMKVPGISQEWVKVSVGDRGELVGDGFAKINGNTVPVAVGQNVSVGTTVQIRNFNKDQIAVVPDSSKPKTVVCEKCGHEMQV